MIGVRARLCSIAIMFAFVAAAWPQMGVPAIPIAATIGQACSMLVIVAAIWFDTAPASSEKGGLQ
jgi:hypothetical protein